MRLFTNRGVVKFFLGANGQWVEVADASASAPVATRAFAPHCDARILHAPGECRYCDAYPDWQEARATQRIAFSGHPTPECGSPCPADAAVAAGLRGDYTRWGGNVARPEGAPVPPSWAAENFQRALESDLAAARRPEETTP